MRGPISSRQTVLKQFGICQFDKWKKYLLSGIVIRSGASTHTFNNEVAFLSANMLDRTQHRVPGHSEGKVAWDTQVLEQQDPAAESQLHPSRILGKDTPAGSQQDPGEGHPSGPSWTMVTWPICSHGPWCNPGKKAATFACGNCHSCSTMRSQKHNFVSAEVDTHCGDRWISYINRTWAGASLLRKGSNLLAVFLLLPEISNTVLPSNPHGFQPLALLILSYVFICLFIFRIQGSGHLSYGASLDFPVWKWHHSLGIP